MKKLAFSIILCLFLIIGFTCNKSVTPKGTVSFGANYGVINCITSVTIYVDNNKIGVLGSTIDNITDCGQNGTITKDLSVGQHSYKVEIRPLSGIGCTKDITGTIQIVENECSKVFIDYYTIAF